ncbi:hypothetical protein MRX96_023110 [Rhipicephalus microplus]
MYIYLKEKGHATLQVSGAKLDFGEGKQEGYNWETCQSHLKRQIWRVRGWKRRVAPIKLNYVTHYARWGVQGFICFGWPVNTFHAVLFRYVTFHPGNSRRSAHV